MKVVQDGPSRERRSVIEVRHWTLGKDFETLRNRVCNFYDSFEGRTIESTTVRRIGPLFTLRKDFETLRNRSLTTMTVVQDKPSRERRYIIEVIDRH